MSTYEQYEKAKAIRMMDEIHAGQTRMDGSPYRWHPLWVMAQVAVWGGNHVQQLGAVLHDAAEDNPEWPSRRIIVEGGFPDELERVLELMNKNNFPDKQANIDEICQHPTVLPIKLADNKHNNNFLPGQTEKDARMAFYDHAREQMLARMYAVRPDFDYSRTPAPARVLALSKLAVTYTEYSLLAQSGNVID